MELNLTLHPRQSEVLTCGANEILYGGAAGGGKSYLARVLAILLCVDVPGIQVYIFRRTYADLLKNHMEGVNGFRSLLAPWVAAGWVKFIGSRNEIVFTFNNSKIFLCHCQHADDRYNYQGAEIGFLIIDEATQMPQSVVEFLRSRVRQTGLVIPKAWKKLVPGMLCTANPGGVSHQYFRDGWVDRLKPGEVAQMPDEEGGMRRAFIPAKLADNPTMAEHDPLYAARLKGLGGKLAKAMLEGDWNQIDGAFFTEFDPNLHVLSLQYMPIEWRRFRAFDWGSYHPFSHGWYALADGETQMRLANGGSIVPSRGSIIKFREWYGKSRPNVGIKLIPEHIAAGILERQLQNERFSDSHADRAFFNKDKGKSIFETWASMGLTYTRANDDRKQGWQQIRARLVGSNGIPSLYFVECCPDTIRTFPQMMHDENDPEDIDSDLEDHAVDETRYACMSRVITPPVQKKTEPDYLPRAERIEDVLREQELELQ